MPGLPRPEWPRCLKVLLGSALMTLAVAPTASAAGPLDTVSVTGTASNSFGVAFSDINISAHSGPSGQDPSGTASFTVSGFLHVSGPVTCLNVTGPDKGGGTLTAPTTAVLKFQDPSVGVVEVTAVDRGGGGADIFEAFPVGTFPSDCSTPLSGGETSLTNGRAVVFDAPLVPTSKNECKNGGWRNFPQFKSQGDCVSFVENGK